MNNHTNKKSSIQGKNMFNIGKELAKQGKELEQQEQLESVSTIYELPLKQATNLLKNMGENWRKDNTEKKNGKEIIKRVPPRIIADDLKQVVKFAVIGDTASDLEKAPLVFYNPDTGLYSNSNRIIDKLILAIDNTTQERNRKEIKKWLALEAQPLTLNKDKNLIPVGNGVFNKETNKLIKFSPDLVFTTKVATNYNEKNIAEPTFNNWSLSNWFKELADNDKHKEQLLWQLIATIVQNKANSNVLFCLIDNGQGRTGKSTFEQLLMNLVGKDNYTALKLAEFDNDFLLAQAYGASLIIGDDNPPLKYIDDGSTLKSVVTNELVLINPKGTPPFSAKFNTTVVQSMNAFPRFRDTTGGLYRRFRLIKFNHQYPDTPAGRKIKDEYIYNEELLQWLLKKALTIDTSTIIDTKESKEMVTDIQLESDIVRSFVADVVNGFTSTRIPVKFLYQLFNNYAEANHNSTNITQNSFTRRIKPILEEQGFSYDRKNKAPLNNFKKDDAKLLPEYWLKYYKENKKKQPIFYK